MISLGLKELELIVPIALNEVNYLNDVTYKYQRDN